ncbi:hypothetical protein KC19_7G105200 [Ceratodon purpureus]|uniref:Uncharacterized protein n=1 Tax=Ceratodon purpureus TaxID=3225 RepID=A0A8T0HA29_CERPU|nr:hypothetical protein KC19_7G105200 [Ceratodon purpureus]
MSTSLAWSSGRVSLLVHCSVPSAGDSRHPSSRKLSCNCTLPGFSSSVTPSILRSGSETGGKSTTVVSLSGGGDSTVEPHRRFVVPGYRRSALESVFSLVVALVMTVGVQGAPSSQDTFEDVPQTLSVFGVDGACRRGEGAQDPEAEVGEGGILHEKVCAHLRKRRGRSPRRGPSQCRKASGGVQGRLPKPSVLSD